jgi:glycosyltransferase involved in cell wall biosynthesis
VTTTPQARRHRVLLTVSGVIEPDLTQRVADGLRPRPDYVELARRLDAELLDVTEARRRGGRLGRLVERIGGAKALLAWVSYRERRRYDAVFTDGEQVGLPLALLCRLTFRPAFAHVMIVHRMSVAKKRTLYRGFRLGRFIDTVVVYCRAQQRFAVEHLGLRDDRVVLSPFMVDTAFFAPEGIARGETDSGEGDRPMICSAGLEFRDYPTLVQAVGDLDARVVIAAACPWSRRSDELGGVALPANVEVCRLGFADLRQLYADADLVVMPLHDVDFQAGVTTILEAQSMAKAVVSSRTEGQTEVIEDGVTGVFVPPGDSAGLRSVIDALLADPRRRATLGTAARRFVVQDCDVAVYADALAAAVTAAIARQSGRPVAGQPVA